MMTTIIILEFWWLCYEVGEEIQLANLLICGDGVHDRKKNSSGAGLDNGQPNLMSSYRSELGGILASVLGLRTRTYRSGLLVLDPIRQDC